jgi:hypothetical protein
MNADLVLIQLALLAVFKVTSQTMVDMFFARKFQLFFRLLQRASFYIARSGNKKLPRLHGSGCALIAKRSAIHSRPA